MSEESIIPKHWKIKKLGDICEIKGGKNQSNVINSNGKYPIYGSSGIFGYADEYLCDEGTTVIGRKGTINSPIYVKTKFWNVDTAFGLCSKDGLNSKFLYFFCTGFNFHKLDKSTTIPSLAKRDLQSIEIPLPPLPEQQAIVFKIEELLSDLENGKQQLQIAQQQLKIYRQSLLKWAFEGKLSLNYDSSEKSLNHDSCDLLDEQDLKNKSKKNPRNHINLQNHSSDNLPKGWKMVDLKEVCEIKRGKSKHRPRNDASLYGGKYPFIQTGDIRNANGGYIRKFSQTYSEEGLQQSKLWNKGTLCITIAANIGETAILGIDACFPDSVVGLVCNEKFLLNKYTNYFFISYKSKLEELAPATAQKNINVDILEKVKIPIPSLKEQQLIVDELESKFTVCDKIEETIIDALLKSESLRQSILKKAFSGELVNNHVNP